MLFDSIKCFGKRALSKNVEFLKNLNKDTVPSQPKPVTKNGKKIVEFFKKALDNKSVKSELQLDPVDNKNALMIKESIGLDIKGYERKITSDGVIHIENEHGVNSNDRHKITDDDIMLYEDIVTNPDKIAKSKTTQGLDAIVYQKRYNDTIYIVEEVRTGSRKNKNPSLALKTMFKNSIDKWKRYKGKDIEWKDVKGGRALDVNISSPKGDAPELYVRNTPADNEIIPQSWYQNQVDKVFDTVGGIIRKSDKKANDLADNLTKGKLKKITGDGFVTVSKTIEEVSSVIEDFRNATRQIYEQAKNRRETLDKMLTYDDKVALHNALGGDLRAKELPSHLTNLYKNIRKMIDDNAEALIKAGALDKKYKIDDYLKRYYKEYVKNKEGFFRNYFDKKFKARKDLTYDERIALGMIEDASLVVPNTIAEQRVQLVKANFLKQVADKFGVDEELDGFVRMSDETVGGGIKKYGALGGKYVPREVADAIKGAGILKENLSALEDVLYPLIDHIKVNVTVKNPTTHLYNFGSNMLMSFLHGDMTSLARVIKMRFSDKAAFDSLVKRAHAQGVVSHLGDMEEMFKNAKPLEGKEPIALTILKNIYMAKGSKSGEFMRNAYGWGDLIFKIAHFDRLTRSGVSDAAAGKAAKKAYVDYSEPLPALLRMADKGGLMPFIGYTYRSTPVVLRAIAKHPFRFAVMQAALIGMGASAWFGDTDRKNAYKPKWAGNKWYVNAFGADSWMKVPVLGGGWYLNSGRLVPAFRYDGFDLLDFQGGFLGGVIKISTGYTPLNRKIDKEDDAAGTKILKRATEMAKNYLPPLTLGRYAQQSAGYITGLNPPKNYYNEEMGVTEIYARSLGVRKFDEQTEATSKVNLLINRQKKELKEAKTTTQRQEIRDKYKWELDRYKEYEKSARFNLSNF
ncbi:MAG: hypothetical protein LBF71_00580 [Campylobacteraceae bacterium]|nr:hypothetical protein [Campylobacteraceae bacterium]